MPWKSKAQERWGNSPAGHKALGNAGVAEWNLASKGKKLPAKVKSPGKGPGGAVGWGGKTKPVKRSKLQTKGILG